MSHPRPYRVRVNIISEGWVDVMAFTPEDAERIAATVKNVVGVYGRSATLAEKKAVPGEVAIYIEENDILGGLK
jgi:hypothetical protein